MPLKFGKSPETFKHNLKAEISAGKPMKQSLAIAYAQKKRKMAHGGEIEHDEMESGYEPEAKYGDMYDDGDHDMVSRIMEKHFMAEGGVIADEGEADELADHKENDFDYLSTGDLDDSSTDSGANDGDDLGDHQEDEDRKDIVARIMRSQSKKDRMPRPA